MGTEDLAVMKAAVDKMRWHEARQKVLSANIANADTPGYKPQDIDPLSFKSLLESSTSSLPLSAGGLTTTNPQHLGLNGTSSSSSMPRTKNQKNPYETSPSGNAVVLEEQLLKMNQNFTDHRLTTTIYQKNIDMLKAALRSQ